MIRVAIADDKVYNRKVIADKLSRSSLFTLSFQAANGNEFLQKMRELKQEELPHIVLMDLEMPEVDGVSAIGTASALYPAVKFVVLTIFGRLWVFVEGRKRGGNHRYAATFVGKRRRSDFTEHCL